MKGILTALFCLYYSCLSSNALVQVNELTSEMRNFEMFMYDYMKTNGAYPKSWRELESFSEHLDWNREPYKLKQRIAFLDEEIHWEDKHRGGRILAITRDAFRPESFRRSRWTKHIKSEFLEPSHTVFVDRSGVIYFYQLPPEQVAEIFKFTGAKLPEPSGLGLYPHEIRVRREKFKLFVLTSICITVILVWITRVILRHGKGKRGKGEYSSLPDPGRDQSL